MTMASTDAYIYEALRTPRGRVRRDGGTLAGIPAYELFAGLLRELSARGVDAAAVEDVLVGVSTPHGEQGAGLAKVAVQAAEWPDTLPAGVVSRMCCSGLDAAASAAAQIRGGGAEIMVAGGAESMSRTPMFSDAPAMAIDPVIGDFTGYVTIGVAADTMAAKFGFTRTQLDEFAAQSHRKTLDAPEWASLVPVVGDGEVVLDHDEGAREGTTVESLAELQPLFSDDPLWARVEERIEGFTRPPQGLHTVATAPQLADGASAILLGSERAQQTLGRAPRGRIVSWAHTSVRSPGLWAGETAARQALARAGLDLADIAVFEFNESFSVSPLLLTRQLGVDPEKVNACGGAVTVGHPLGASGGILIANALDQLDRIGGGYGLLVIPAALGLATALVVEAL
ncbi:MAG: acetyl-CoA C-acyltransferase [Leucobacter sp.]|nr:acetyl-CoA C-acyltransferase [Leucobacter sp.]